MGRSRSRSRSRSISPVRRKRAKERDRSKKRKHRNRSVSREKRRRSVSRERDGRAGGSWIGSSHRSENRGITRSRSKSRSYERPSSSSKSKNNPSTRETGSLEGKSHEELEMMKVMGFCGFDTTKNKKVDGNDPGAVHVILKRKYRQYMNRKGGFNRPLDFVA